MNRRDAMKLFAGAAATGLLGRSTFAQDKVPSPKGFAFDTAKAVVTKVKENVYLLTGPGGNIAFAPDAKGTLMVDCGVPGRTDDIKSAVASVTPSPVRLLVNTHWHFDHSGGNEALAKAGVQIIAHENTRTRLSNDQMIDLMKMKMPASPKDAWPTQTFSDSQTIYHGSEKIHLTHVAPAHTDTDILVHFRKANVLHMGDLYFNTNSYPFIDYSSGGNLDGMIAASEKALKICNADTQIIPGHGPVSGIAELKAYLSMLIAVRDLFKPLIDAGKTLPEVIAAKPTGRLEAQYGSGFITGDMAVEMFYKSMVKAK